MKKSYTMRWIMKRVCISDTGKDLDWAQRNHKRRGFKKLSPYVVSLIEADRIASKGERNGQSTHSRPNGKRPRTARRG